MKATIYQWLQLLQLLRLHEISGRIAFDIWRECERTGKWPAAVIDEWDMWPLMGDHSAWQREDIPQKEQQ